MPVKQVPVTSIQEHPDRFYRKSLEGVDSLAASMQGENGQLQPIVVDKESFLVFGKRRLAAAKQLGWENILANVVNLADPLKAIEEENGQRLDFTLSEKAALGLAIETVERAKAEERRRQHGGTAPGRGKKGKESEEISTTNGETLPDGSAPPSNGEAPAAAEMPEADFYQAEDKVAKSLGMSRPTYRKLKEVVEAAQKDPALQPLVDEMDARGKVSGTHKQIFTEPKKKKGKMGKKGRGEEKFNAQLFVDALGKARNLLDSAGSSYGKGSRYLAVESMMEKTMGAWNVWMADMKKQAEKGEKKKDKE